MGSFEAGVIDVDAAGTVTDAVGAETDIGAKGAETFAGAGTDVVCADTNTGDVAGRPS